MNLSPGDLLVARGWSWKAEYSQKRCKTDYKDQLAQVSRGELDADKARPSLSIYTMLYDGSCTADELASTLADYVATKLSSARHIGFVTWNQLDDAGFNMAKSEPPQHHWDLFIENLDEIEEFEKLFSMFENDDKRRLNR
ncbi:hypothetical protein [Curtobacterium sp. AB7]|uniref:hypothetical protein n=1 Tax=Curtobacterium sp. AB7 TaxID=3349327 RepID=UPI003836FAB9